MVQLKVRSVLTSSIMIPLCTSGSVLIVSDHTQKLENGLM